MGSGVVFSNLWGQGRREELKTALVNAFGMIALMALALTLLSYALLGVIAALLRVPAEAAPYLTDYLRVIFGGIFFVFLYNFFAAVLRSVGNSAAPLIFLLVSTVLNVALDLYLVLVAGWGVAGAAWATVIAQGSRPWASWGISSCACRICAPGGGTSAWMGRCCAGWRGSPCSPACSNPS